jgi:CBS domain-containing protein
VLTKIDSVLNVKGRDVWSVSPDSTVHDALQLMAEKRIETCLILAEGKLVGMLTERDCARRVMLLGKNPRDVRVRDVMTTPVVFVTPTHTVADCMKILTDRGFAHLPVLVGETVVGVVSMGDLVNKIVRDQGDTITHLEAYITGKYPG